MNLSKTDLGPFQLYTIETGRFKLDGGAMFGVVPKTLWSRHIEADANNRIPMAARCLLIESEQTGRVYLIDNGVGTKFDEKMSDIYQVDASKTDLISSLDAHGFTPDDITDLVLTHLHFDHCGGTTYFDDNGNLQHRFKNARYHITKTHWETATNPNARETASFLDSNIQPIANSDKLNLVEEGHTFEKGLSTIIANGHTLGQQLPKIETNGKTIIFAADLLPTRHHLSLPWVMGYDMRPIQTLSEKENFLDKACNHNWYIYLEHDATAEIIKVYKEDGRFKYEDTSTLNDI